ncbi:iron-sulfur cluster assembly accessory protein [Idiomarina piscisalsi]|uniref:Iron-sulfur cluster assembly accessory protein n=1 Tax=Idiomarina piscisalsi TaxID=1096243 RepID=A0ABM6LW58_9GAMM|nr:MULTISPECIES: iron-sulfur cluster assembly accessory protein [Idiomarina]ASG66771.1 iron-sulfur cluster assembly accessory protein [Idiomarina piscisalsi]RXS43400.1 iron-sulfur cluster assembly accessory protein [Idiomarina sp. 29L]
MSVETFSPSSSLISMTDSAIKYFESRLKNESGHLIRLSTKQSGCTGYAYVLDSVDAIQDGDEVVEINDNIKVAIAPNALELVRNTEIDYVKEGINGIVKFNNPNVVNECGCGESFSVT